MEELVREGRSLKETPTWSVAAVTTVMVFLCFFAQRSIYNFGKWLKKTRRKALCASLEKIKEELMLLGLISLLLGQWASVISQICLDSSLFSSKFFLCSREDFEIKEHITLRKSMFLNETEDSRREIKYPVTHHCGKGREPFVSHEGLEQLNRFLFVLGITHVLYSCVAVGLAMSKIYSWRKWEYLARVSAESNFQAKRNKVMRRQSTFILHHASHPWIRSRVLIWMLCFFRQFRTTIQKSDYFALRLGFITVDNLVWLILHLFFCTSPHIWEDIINTSDALQVHNLPLSYNFHNYMVRSMEEEFYGMVGISWPLWGYAIICIFINIHGLNIYFWIAFIPAILAMLVGTKQQHIVSLLALEIVEPKDPSVGSQVKPSDHLFWFRKPEILLRLIQFISFQNAFEMATFIWSLWGLKQRSCFMKNHTMIIIRLTCGIVVQFWCSYSTVPLNVIITQMGSRCKKALIAESVRDSLHSWCKRVKERSKRDAVNSIATRSTCSLGSTIDEGDEIITVVSPTISPCSSNASLNQLCMPSSDDPPANGPDQFEHEHSFRTSEYATRDMNNGDVQDRNEEKTVTLFELLRKT